MLNNLPSPIPLDIAILSTALACSVGFYVAERKFFIFASLAIGCFVCLLGYSVASLGAPGWAIIAAPFPLDIFLLWYVLKNPRKMAVAYLVGGTTYVLLHVLLSMFLHYDSLIPIWKIHT